MLKSTFTMTMPVLIVPIRPQRRWGHSSRKSSNIHLTARTSPPERFPLVWPFKTSSFGENAFLTMMRLKEQCASGSNSNHKNFTPQVSRDLWNGGTGVYKFVWRLCWKINVVCMSLSAFDSFQSRFVTYLLNCPRIFWIQATGGWTAGREDSVAVRTGRTSARDREVKGRQRSATEAPFRELDEEPSDTNWGIYAAWDNPADIRESCEYWIFKSTFWGTHCADDTTGFQLVSTEFLRVRSGAHTAQTILQVFNF
jgi:hypothetical protein